MNAVLDDRMKSAAFVEATPVALLFQARGYEFWAECADCAFRSNLHDEGERDGYFQEWNPDLAILAAYAEVERHHDMTHSGVGRG